MICPQITGPTVIAVIGGRQMKARVFLLAIVLMAVGLAVFAHLRSLSGGRPKAARPQIETTGSSTNLPRSGPWRSSPQ